MKKIALYAVGLVAALVSIIAAAKLTIDLLGGVDLGFREALGIAAFVITISLISAGAQKVAVAAAAFAAAAKGQQEAIALATELQAQQAQEQDGFKDTA